MKGNDAKTVKALREFRAVAVDPATVTVEEVRQVLARDTDALIARLSWPRGRDVPDGTPRTS